MADRCDLDLVTVGRISVDLYAEQLDVPLAAVQTYRRSIGGTATNVAVAAARLGRRAAVVTRVGDDPLGGYVRDALADSFDVDTRFVGIDPTFRTPLAFATMADRSAPDLDFYRYPSAPDMQITPADVDRTTITSVPILWFPASCLSAEPSRTTIHELLRWRARRTHTIFDLDWRPMFWPDADHARAAIGQVLSKVTIAIGNRDECEVAVGERDPERAADALLAHGLQASVVKLGDDGVLVATADGQRTWIEPHRIEVVCGLGAGDAFGGAFCHGLLSGYDIAESARYGNLAGAIVAGRLMCADDMPTLAELDNTATRLEQS